MSMIPLLPPLLQGPNNHDGTMRYGERRRMSVELNLHRGIPIHFARIVRQSAGRIAVRDGEQTLTYANLDRASDRVAAAIMQIAGNNNYPYLYCLTIAPKRLSPFWVYSRLAAPMLASIPAARFVQLQTMLTDLKPPRRAL